VFLLLLAVVFGAVTHHFSKITFGKKPEGLPATAEPAGQKAVLALLLALILVLGLYIPGGFSKLIESAVAVLRDA
jgi:hypothetical protein